VTKRFIEKLFCLELILLPVLSVFFVPPLVVVEGAQELQVYSSPVVYPLPSVPEPILANETLKVQVAAGSSAGGWVARITSKYASFLLVNLNSSNVGNGKWILFFKPNGTLSPGLYSLNIAYSDGGKVVNYTQPRSVWVLEDWPDKLTIGHVTDTHFPYGAEVAATYVYEANLIHPDMIIHTGDLVDIETLSSAWIYFQKIFNRLLIPCYILPGNHDHSGKSGAYYKKYCGPLNYSVVIGDFLFIALNNGDGGVVKMEQLEWAEKILQKNSDKIKIIGFHYPFFSRVPGRNINGSWEHIESLEPYMYYTWRDSLNESRMLLRLIEEYDVRLILAGHVHQDVNYVYNGKHYFITTVACGGSIREGHYYGSRLIEIDRKGNLKFDAYTQSGFFETPNSMPVGNIKYYYRTVNDGSKAAVSATVINQLKQNITGARLEFIVSKEYPAEDYQFYPTAPARYETVTTENGHHFIAYVDVPSESSVYLTLAAVKDETNPTVKIELPDEIEEQKPVTVIIEASDDGWGVKNLEASCLVDGKTLQSWTFPEIPLQVNKEKAILEYPVERHEITIPRQPAGTEVTIEATAIDFAGNSQTYKVDFTVGAPPVPTYTLRIYSSPFSGLSFTLESQSHSTPYSTSLETGNYTVNVPEKVTVDGKPYKFVQWEDGVTSTSRTISLTSDTTLTVQYKEAPPPEQSLPLEIVAAAAAIAITVIAVVIVRRK